jgi:NADH:ubiquinone oxidoreductase subunit 2 (subunit N)
MSVSLINFYLYLNIVVYIIPLIMFYLLISESQLTLQSLHTPNKSNYLTKMAVLFFLINLAGLPPLPGFFIKLNLFLIFLNYTNIISAIFFVVLNFIVFFFYIKSYRNLKYVLVNITYLPTYNQTILLLGIIAYICFFLLAAPYFYIHIYKLFI